MKRLPHGNNINLKEGEFYNRSRELNRIKSLLETTEDGNAPDLLITGIRGVGKSVLLKEVKKMFVEDYLVVYINFSYAEAFQTNNMSIFGLMDYYYQSIMDECDKRNIGSFKEKVDKFLKTNDFHLKDFNNYNGIPLPLIENETNLNKLNKFVLGFPEEIYNSNKGKIKGVIMIIDEFQIIKELGDYKEGFLWLLRGFMQEQNNVAYILSGSMNIYDKLIYEIAGKQGVFGGRLLTLQVEPFSKETTRNYLSEKLPELKFTDEGFERFYKCTSGIPAYINTFANELPLNVELDGENVLEELDDNLDLLTSSLTTIWGRLKLNEQKILISLIKGPKMRKEIAKELDISSGSLSIYLNNLQDLQLIEFREGRYHIFEPLLARWLEVEYNKRGIYPHRLI